LSRRCGDSRYPRKKWKTRNGFLNHECEKSPEKIKKVQEDKERWNKEVDLRKQVFQENKQLCKYKVGDIVVYVVDFEYRKGQITDMQTSSYVPSTEIVKNIKEGNVYYKVNFDMVFERDIKVNEEEAKQEIYRRMHTCAYCSKPIEDDDLHWESIISRMWRPSFKSPRRPYHKSKGCAIYDQMAYEG
jgi:hypothetical protein